MAQATGSICFVFGILVRSWDYPPGQVTAFLLEPWLQCSEWRAQRPQGVQGQGLLWLVSTWAELWISGMDNHSGCTGNIACTSKGCSGDDKL